MKAKILNDILTDCKVLYGFDSNWELDNKIRKTVDVKRLFVYFCYKSGIASETKLSIFLDMNRPSLPYYIKTYYLIEIGLINTLIGKWKPILGLTNDDIDRLKEPFEL